MTLGSIRSFWTAFLMAVFMLSYGCSEKVEFKKSEAPVETPSERSASTAAGPAEPVTPEADGPLAANNSDVNTNTSSPMRALAPSTLPRAAEPKPAIIPGGRRLTVRLLETISSRSANPGERFDAVLAAPLVINGRTVLAGGTPLRGRVVAARSSGRLHKPGFLRLTLDSLRAPDGRWVQIKTTSVWAKGKSHKKRNIALIGGGTGVGAVIGAIAGGGKGAAIGALSGAGAGTAGAYATGKKDVTLPAEHRLSFSTTREIPLG